MRAMNVNVVNRRGVLRKTGRAYGGFVGFCLWLGLVAPWLAVAYLVVGACILLRNIVLTIVTVVQHYRGTSSPAVTSTPDPRDPSARRAAQLDALRAEWAREDAELAKVRPNRSQAVVSNRR